MSAHVPIHIFFFNDTATTEIYTLSLHDALPIYNSANTGTPVQQPHFDDERTVQSAQPVVPLEQINAKVRHRRHWVLGGAFAIAMMLGAASALVASYLKLRNTATPVAEAEVSSAPVVV